MDRQATARIARELGHLPMKIEPTKSGNRFFIECACGWGRHLADGRPTVTAATMEEATRRALHHVDSAVRVYLRELAANGGRVPAHEVRQAG